MGDKTRIQTGPGVPPTLKEVPTPTLTAEEEASVQIEAHEKAVEIVASSGGDFASTYHRIASELRARFKAPTPKPMAKEQAAEYEQVRSQAFEEVAEMADNLELTEEMVPPSWPAEGVAAGRYTAESAGFALGLTTLARKLRALAKEQS